MVEPLKYYDHIENRNSAPPMKLQGWRIYPCAKPSQNLMTNTGLFFRKSLTLAPLFSHLALSSLY